MGRAERQKAEVLAALRAEIAHPRPASLDDADERPVVGYLCAYTPPELLRAAGVHPLRLIYFQHTGGKGLELRYEGPGVRKQLVPRSAFLRRGRASSGIPQRRRSTQW